MTGDEYENKKAERPKSKVGLPAFSRDFIPE